MCWIAPDEHCPVWQETKSKARKVHTCSSCRGTIKTGETYVRHRSLFDGQWHSAKCCALCDGAREIFAAAHGGLMWTPDQFPYALIECIGEDEESAARWLPMEAEIRARGLLPSDKKIG